jgi:hypothetical protein
MAMRPDPVEILARVSNDRERAFETWIYLAGKAGWTVTEESRSLDQPGTLCGVVDVEGLRYAIHYGPRVRHLIHVVPAGVHLISAVARATSGEPVEFVDRYWELAPAAWAEPFI